MHKIHENSISKCIEKEAKLKSVWNEILTEFELRVDSCEQPIEKPGEYQEHKKHYSGKKKKHTKKNQLIVLPFGKTIN